MNFIVHSVFFLYCCTIIILGASSEVESTKRLLEDDCLNIMFDPMVANIWSYTVYTTLPQDGKFNYHFFHENGTLIESGSKLSSTICYDIMDCHYLLLSGNSRYEINSGGTLMSGEIFYDSPVFIHLGKCVHQCKEKEQVVVAGEVGRDFFWYTSSKVIHEETFTQATLKAICVKADDCYTLGGSVSYLASRDDLVIENGNTFRKSKTFGTNCETKCEKKPLLADSSKGQMITPIIYAVSGNENLRNVYSSHYMAACWIIYEDLYEFNATDYKLIIQRYILALLYYENKGKEWKYDSHYLSPKNECNWNGMIYFSDWNGYIESGTLCNEYRYVSTISMESVNLSGILLPQLSKLTSLGKQ